MILSEINFFSNVLSVRSSIKVILPQHTPVGKGLSPNPKMRTLYLLHGYADDYTAWQRWTSIECYVEGLNLAVIMPSANNSFYTDMVHGGKYFTYITQELPAIVRDIFPLSAERSDTFVAGVSMGGYGAFKLALSRPDLFAAAASLSGVLDIREVFKVHDDPDNPVWLENMHNIFGDFAAVPGSNHDLFSLAERVSQSSLKPRLFQYCGTDDFLYADNLRFRDHVRTLPLDYTYMEGPGDHRWKYWDETIQKVLTWQDAK